MTDKITNNSSESTKAIVHQFYVALEKCFELEEGESAYIEYYGDVSIVGKSQIEVKKFQRTLTNLDQNFWNTLKNWMEDNFPHEKFRSLILSTTQNISSKSIFKNWNENSFDTRLKDMTDVRCNYFNQKKRDEKTIKLLNYIFDKSRREKLTSILPKIVIQSSQRYYQNLHNSIKDRFAKGIPKSSKDQFIRGLLGFIISPEISENNKWEITNEKFSKEVEELTSVLTENSVLFPKKIDLKDIDNTKYLESTFVKKIEDIEYNDVIPTAISDYVHTNTLIFNDVRLSMRYQELKRYQDEINEDHEIKFRNRKRNAPKNNVINASKDFYDEFLGKDPNTFYLYNTVPPYFRRGLIQNMANDIENYKIEWKISNE
jgi:hypothetical protein